MFPADLRWFGRAEFRYPDEMWAPFLRWLDRVRERAGVRMVITDDFRPGGPTLHGKGRAVDVRTRDLTPNEYFRLLQAVLTLASEAPGAVEIVVGYRAQPHLHVGVDDRPRAQPELIEATE